MAFHTLAYGSATFNAATFTELPPVSEQIVRSTNSKYFVLSQDMKLIAAYTGASAIRRARVNSATLRQISPAYVTPLNATAGGGSDPNVMDLTGHGLMLRREEEVSMQGVNAGVDNSTGGLLWISDGDMTPVPAGEARWINMEYAAIPTALSTYTWLSTSYTFEAGSLPAGSYAVTGFVFKHEHAVAARLIFDRQVWRPGTLAINGTNNQLQKPHELFTSDKPGVWGVFETFSPPRLEVLLATATDDTAAGTGATGHLRVVRIS